MPGMPRRKPAPVADTLRRYRGRIHAEGHSTGLKTINFLAWQMVLRALIYRRCSGQIYSLVGISSDELTHITYSRYSLVRPGGHSEAGC